jgi:adenine-specific DNA-methyltransferase
MGHTFHNLEQQRVALQIELDGQKTQAERNKLGQFSTPAALARDMLRYAGTLLPKGEKIRFLDPAIGTGAFYSALRREYPNGRVTEATGFEIDPHYGHPSAALWGRTGLNIILGDFTCQKPDPRFNVLICNPPYVRHHHMTGDEKALLQMRTAQACGTKIGGLAGLYCHFLGLSHAWMAERGVAGWLIPSEFMDVNYGQAVKRYLLNRTTLLHIHRFDPNDVQFADALVSSAVVWFQKSPPPKDHAVTFSFGGSLFDPNVSRAVPVAALAQEAKWTRFPVASVRQRSTLPTISDFFKIKRGLATGDNSYFILTEHEIAARDLPMKAFRPILPSPRYVTADVIQADAKGHPRLDQRLFLLDLRIGEEEIQRRYPTLWSYLEEGKARGLHERYLCRHRALWYAQENRPPAPIVCTYLGRGDTKSGRPFRFILNRSQATVANVYLAMYPTLPLTQALARDPELINRVWTALNQISPEHLLEEGRVYGGGLHKLEPKELANVPVPALADLLPKGSRPAAQAEMFAGSMAAE